MIVVTGATGQLGGAVVERLLARLPAGQVAVSVRDPARAAALAARGVRVRRGDFAEPATLTDAFEGATQVLLVSASTHGDAALRQHRAAVDAARDSGARRILYTSHQGVDPASAFAPMRDHAATEEMLRGSGVPYTALRNGFYASTALMLLRQALATGVLAAPADGPVSWTAHADLAEATAIVLTGDGIDGPTAPLTGSEALDLTDLAALAGSVTGRPVIRTVVPAADHRATLVGHGAPPAVADMLLGMFTASAHGAFTTVDPTLERILGHPPTPVRTLLTEATQEAPAA